MSFLATTTATTVGEDQYCPIDFPFAYLNGNYCCSTNEEQPGGGLQSEIESGSCDGIGFGRDSRCCKDQVKACPHLEGCYNNPGSEGNLKTKNYFAYYEAL